MAHWAEVDSINKVTRVLVTTNEGDEGYQWLVDVFGGRWIKTSYNSFAGKRLKEEMVTIIKGDGSTEEIKTTVVTDEPHFRYNFASIGFTYDEVRDAFIPPKPEEGNWVLNEETCLWEEVTE